MAENVAPGFEGSDNIAKQGIGQGSRAVILMMNWAQGRGSFQRHEEAQDRASYRIACSGLK